MLEQFLRKQGANIFIALIGGLIGAWVFSAISPRASDFIDNTSPEDAAIEVLQNLEASESQVVSAVDAVQPAVVSIVLTKDVPVFEQSFDDFNPFGNFPGFFNNPFSFRVPRLEQKGTERQEVGGGSGFLVSRDGLIVTNRHVVEATDVEYTVFLSTGESYEAEVVARDPANDVAVVKIEGNDLPFLEFANSDDLKVGQTAIAIGNSLGEFRNTVSTGVISGLARSITAGNGFGSTEQLEEVIQTDAAINPGNSGGPLLNLRGQVVGVNVAVALGSENIGFALPANVVKSVVDSVQETGRISRPFIGVRYVPITPAMQEANNLSVDYGVLILRGDTREELAVIPGSPADKAGLVEGDIILEVDGQRLDGDTSLAALIRKKNVGDSIELTVFSKGSEKKVRVVLEELAE